MSQAADPSEDPIPASRVLSAPSLETAEARVREAVGALLAHYEIDRAVVIDDEGYRLQLSDVIAAIKQHGENALLAIGSLGRELDIDRPEEVWREDLEGRWGKLDKDELPTLFVSLAALDGENSVAHARFASVVTALLPIPTDTIYPHEWGAKQPDLIDARCIETNGKKRCCTLVLFDLDLSKAKANASPEGGWTLAVELLGTRKDIEIVCGIISSKAPDAGLPPTSIGGTGIDPRRVVRIAKSDLPDDPWQFVYGLKKALLAPTIDTFRQAAIEVIEKAHAAAQEELAGVDIFDFVYAVITRSDDEGVRDWETLFRLYRRFMGDHLRRQAFGHGSLGGLGDAIRQVAVLAPEVTEVRKPNAWRLQRRDVVDLIEDVNSFHLPLGSGDVFECRNEQGQGRLFVLLSPPCDLFLRLKGDRRLEHGLLVPMTPVAGHESDSEAGTTKIIPYFSEDGSPVRVRFPDAVSVPLWVLDLCAYHSTGEAKIAEGENAPSHLSPGLLERYKIVTRKAMTVIQGTINRPPAGRAGSWREAQQNIPLFPRQLGAAFQSAMVGAAPRSLSIECRRIGRIQPAYAADLLTRFGHYLSRAAFDTDLGKFPESMNKA